VKRVPLASLRLKATNLVNGEAYAATVERAASSRDDLFLWLDDDAFDELRDGWAGAARQPGRHRGHVVAHYSGGSQAEDETTRLIRESGDQRLLDALARAESMASSGCTPCQRSSRWRGLRRMYDEWSNVHGRAHCHEPVSASPDQLLRNP
jgi:hypothetical protein